MSTRAYATVTGPAATYTAPDGHREPITTTGDEDIRLAVVRRATDEARRAGAPVELVTSGDRGDHHLLVHADGTLGPVPPPAPPFEDTLPGERTADEYGPDVNLEAEAVELFGDEIRGRAPEPEEAAATPEPAAEAPRTSFITPAPDAHKSGWAAVMKRFGAGESRAQQARDRAVEAVSRQWAGCRTIAVVNGKGGVGKTMTTAMLAAVFARHGGGNVLAWDNNDTRGTLGWRTEPGLYDTTIRDLLHHTEHLLHPAAAVSEIAGYVHHQGDDRYDVLRSNPKLLASDQRLTTAEFDRLMQVAARYYRLVVFDSGNDESAERWLRMIDSSYQVVLPTLATPESAESAALLLDELRARDIRSAALADRAVVVVTQSEPTRPRDLARIVDGFTPHVRTVTVIPHDPALKGGPLRFDSLRPRTRDAWIRTAATTADGL